MCLKIAGLYEQGGERYAQHFAVAELGLWRDGFARRKRTSGTRRRALFRLEAHDLVHAAGVTAAVEGGLQPDPHHLLHELLAQEVGGEAEDVGVVVSAAHLGGDGVVAGGGADAAHLVGGDAHADVGAANQNAALDLALADGFADQNREIGIIDALGPGGAHVEHFVSEAFEEGDKPALGLEAAVVAADGNLHDAFSWALSSSTKTCRWWRIC